MSKKNNGGLSQNLNKSVIIESTHYGPGHLGVALPNALCNAHKTLVVSVCPPPQGSTAACTPTPPHLW